MNKERRTSLDEIWNELNEQKAIRGNEIDAVIMDLSDKMTAAKESFEGFRDRIQEVLDGEQEAFDNMPEGLQNSERGQAMTEAIEYMEESVSKLDEAIEKLDIDISTYDIESECQESLDAIDNAKGES